MAEVVVSFSFFPICFEMRLVAIATPMNSQNTIGGDVNCVAISQFRPRLFAGTIAYDDVALKEMLRLKTTTLHD